MNFARFGLQYYPLTLARRQDRRLARLLRAGRPAIDPAMQQA
jgi:hypothetical protein